jgi:hypothetical protein
MAPKNPHDRQLLALELGVGYIWCPPVVYGEPIMEDGDQRVEVLTRPVEIRARTKRKKKAG